MASLAALPAELLLAIIESGSLPREQRHLIITLRTTCVEINTKIKYYFGVMCSSDIKVRLRQYDLEDLQAISRSPLGVHTRQITINVNTLREGGLYKQIPGEGEESRSWFSFAALEALGDKMNYDDEYAVRLNDTIAEFILDGSCGQMLSTALSGFTQLRTLRIEPPAIFDWISASVYDEFQRVWLIASKILLNVAFAQVSSLEEFLLWHDDDEDYDDCKRSIPLSLSALEVGALAWSSWTASLRKLQL
jgi:hypothetical protein